MWGNLIGGTLFFRNGGGPFLFFGIPIGGTHEKGKGGLKFCLGNVWGELAPGGSGMGPNVPQLVGQVKNKNIKTEKNIPPPGGPGGGMGWGRDGGGG